MPGFRPYAHDHGILADAVAASAATLAALVLAFVAQERSAFTVLMTVVAAFAWGVVFDRFVKEKKGR